MKHKNMTRREVEGLCEVLAGLRQDQQEFRQLLHNLTRKFEEHSTACEQGIDCRLSTVEMRMRKLRGLLGDDHHASL